MTVQIILTRATDANDDPLSGALAHIYEEGTTTPVTTYQEASLTTAHTNPIVASSDGRFAQAFYGGTKRLKVVYQTSSGAALFTEDPAKTVLYDGSSASQVGYDGSTSGLGSTTVQAAIDEVYTAVTDNTANAQTVTATGGSSNAYTLTAASTITAYAAGQEFLVRINHANTGAATLNVDGLGAKAIQKYDGAGSLNDLVSGDLIIDAIETIHYDGTRFILKRSRSEVKAGSGTWTLTVEDNTTRGAGNVSATTATGNWERIGNLMFIQVNIDNIDVTGLSAGNVYLHGVELTPGNTNFSLAAQEGTPIGGLFYSDVNLTAGAIDVEVVANTGGYLTIHETFDAGTNVILDVSQLSGADLRFAGVFVVS